MMRLLSLLLAVGTAAPGAEQVEKHRLGSYVIEAEGVPAKLHLDIQFRYGLTPDPRQVAAVRRGDLEWVLEKPGETPSWKVYAPRTYEPETPYGLFVYVSPGDKGGLEEEWKAVLERHKLLWIAAQRSGNDHDVPWRQSLALYGARLMMERYNVDADRVYIGGWSGGGRLASHAAIMHGDLFRGGFYIDGCNTFSAFAARLKPADLAPLRSVSRFVLLTGSKDMNKPGTQDVFEFYKRQGFRNVTYLEVPGKGHNLPSGEWFEKGIVALDEPLGRAAEQSYKAAAAHAERDQLGQALAGYARAAAHGGEAGFVAEARAKAEALRAEYAQAVATIEQAIEASETTRARKGLAELKRQWSDHARADVQRLTDMLRSGSTP